MVDSPSQISVVAGVLAITALSGWLLVTKLKINNSLEVFAPDSPEMDALTIALPSVVTIYFSY